ncbi:hypothetical protein DXG01_016703 [Tephrocybe rancida]|nr:hypothetical protein DXG01_016703 [Tephrocybe rancida]
MLALLREVVPWAQLSHDNVLPFSGLCEIGDSHGRLGLVSPYLENGNVMQFLKRNPLANRQPFILDAAIGLSYLHENGYVHGDIKGANILVTDTLPGPPRACLADFGFITVTDSGGPGSVSLTSKAMEGGTIQYEAPELRDPEIPYRRTSSSDVYALSMASYEILTGNIPYPGKTNNQVMVMVSLDRRPIRPAFLPESTEPHDYSWQQDPGRRPTAHEIVDRLQKGGKGWGEVDARYLAVIYSSIT